MTVANDMELVREFARNRSEAAFTELVRRHVNLVYSIARRCTGSDGDAEDVTQAVFVILARKAAGLRARTVLTGWLAETTRYTAACVVRGHARRHAREQEAYMQSTLTDDDTAEAWARLAPHLETGMAQLGERDRTLLTLRFYENKTGPEAAALLGLREAAVHKRTARALEKLRKFFTQRGIELSAATIAGAVAANSVQAAPEGLAAAITAAALSGTTITTTAFIAATKAIAMTTIQKTLITAALIASVGAGIYEAKEIAAARAEVRTLQQQQAPLAEQIQQLQTERDKATNRLAGLLAENFRLKSNPNQNELLKLRGEVTQLRTAKTQRENNPTDAAVKALMDKENQIKEYVEQHPNEKIPEFQFLGDQSWLTIAEAKFETTNDYQNAMRFLRFQAEDGFGALVANALMKYSDANNQQFPSDLSQLQPYLDPAAEDMLTQLYAIAPASIVKDAPPKFVNGVRMSDANPMIGNWIITRKIPADPNSPSRFAIYTGGTTYWQSSSGSDNQ